MKRIKVLHCADLHLGSELTSLQSRYINRAAGGIYVSENSGYNSIAKSRRQDLLRSFRLITEICNQENIDLLLIAGDLFEGNNVDDATINSVKSYLSEMKNTIAAITPGNHDYFSIDSPYAEHWPENVVVFRGGIEKIVFQDRGFAIYGAAFTRTYIKESLMDCILDVDEHLINIGILHADLVSESGDSVYNPITETQIAKSGLDYIALGHIHKKSEIMRAGKTSFAYSGCPEARGFDELGEKGIYIGIVGQNYADFKFRKVCSRIFDAVDIDISGLFGETEIVDHISSYLLDLYGKNYIDNFYKIILKGQLPMNFNLPLAVIEDRLNQNIYFAKVIDKTHIKQDLDALAKESSLKGIFTKKMLEQIKSSEKAGNDSEIQKLQKALEIGLRCFDGEVNLNDY